MKNFICGLFHFKKRQIYREQVQPHSGGKIPDSAFETDRLILNRLQKEGIAVPDGITLEQRNPKVFPYAHNDLRPVFKVVTIQGDHLINGASEDAQPSIGETTYPIPRISEDRLSNIPILSTIYHPIYRPFALTSNIDLRNSNLNSNSISSPEKICKY